MAGQIHQMQMKMACQAIAYGSPNSAVHGPSMQQNQVRAATCAERFDMKTHLKSDRLLGVAIQLSQCLPQASNVRHGV